MIGHPRRLDARGERAQLLEIGAIQGRGAADGQRYPVQGERIALAEAHEVVQRLAAGDQVVLGEHLEPVDVRAFREHRLVVIDPEAEAESERGAREHGC